MWPFRRRKPSLTSALIDDQWEVIQGQYDGRPIILRLHKGVGRVIAHPQLPYRLGIAVPLHSPDERGFPAAPELKALEGIEDAIHQALSHDFRGVKVLVITTNGMREFVSYIQNESAARAALDAAGRSAAGHEIQHRVSPDPQWSVYRKFSQYGGK